MATTTHWHGIGEQKWPCIQPLVCQVGLRCCQVQKVPMGLCLPFPLRLALVHSSPCCFDGSLKFQIIFLPSSLKLPFLVQWSFWVESAQTKNTSLQKQRQKVTFLQEGRCFGFFPSPPTKELSLHVILPFFSDVEQFTGVLRLLLTCDLLFFTGWLLS